MYHLTFYLVTLAAMYYYLLYTHKLYCIVNSVFSAF